MECLSRNITLLSLDTFFDYRFRMLGRPFKFTAEAYYKALSNLIPYSVNNVKVIYYGDNKCSGHAMGIDNVNSYYWITDVTNQQYAVPNYLTGRQINGRVLFKF